MFRRRVAEELASHVEAKPWEQFDRCPREDLRSPDRVYVDPFGNLHVCQGLSVGNLLRHPFPDVLTPDLMYVQG